MKRILSLLLVSILLLSLSGCGKSPVLPPVRTGTGELHIQLTKNFTFESAFEEADAVVRIKIGDWLGEDTDIHYTYYEATVLQCLKGSIPETFTLLQIGCSTATVKTYPLFTSGNEFLAFLNQTYVQDYTSPYVSVGAYTTYLDVSYDASGNRYFIDRFGYLGATMNIDHNYAQNKDIYAEVKATVTKKDQIFEESQFQYIFSEADIKTLIDKQ